MAIVPRPTKSCTIGIGVPSSVKGTEARLRRSANGISFNLRIGLTTAAPYRRCSYPTKQRSNENSLKLCAREQSTEGFSGLVALKGAVDFFIEDTIELHQLDDHHIFPTSFLKSKRLRKDLRNSILNRTLISRDTNRRLIRAKKPSVYLAEMESGLGKETARLILATHFIGDAAIQAMRDDDYLKFLEERERALRAEIARRCVYSPYRCRS